MGRGRGKRRHWAVTASREKIEKWHRRINEWPESKRDLYAYEQLLRSVKHGNAAKVKMILDICAPPIAMSAVTIIKLIKASVRQGNHEILNMLMTLPGTKRAFTFPDLLESVFDCFLFSDARFLLPPDFRFRHTCSFLLEFPFVTTFMSDKVASALFFHSRCYSIVCKLISIPRIFEALDSETLGMLFCRWSRSLEEITRRLLSHPQFHHPLGWVDYDSSYAEIRTMAKEEMTRRGALYIFATQLLPRTVPYHLRLQIILNASLHLHEKQSPTHYAPMSLFAIASIIHLDFSWPYTKSEEAFPAIRERLNTLL